MCNIQTNQETWQEIFYYILRQSDGASFGMHALSPSHGQKDHEQDVPRKKNPNFISNWNSVWNFNRLCVSLVSTDEFATELPQTIKIFTFVILAWWSLIRFLLTSRSCNIKKAAVLILVARYTRYFHCSGAPARAFWRSLSPTPARRSSSTILAVHPSL